MTQKLVINKALGATLNSGALELKRGDSIVVKGLAGSETADLYIKVGDTFETATDSSGTAIQITETKKSVVIEGAGTYQVQIGTTAGAVVLSVNTN